MKEQVQAAKSSLDFTAFSALKSGARKEDPQAIKAAAKQFEALFLQSLLKSMRQSNAGFESEYFNSFDTGFYRDMHDQQLASDLAEKGTLGFAELIMKQFGAQQTANEAGQKLQPELPFPSLNEMVTKLKANLPEPFKQQLAANLPKPFVEQMKQQLPEVKIEMAASEPVKTEVKPVETVQAEQRPAEIKTPTDFVKLLWNDAVKVAKGIGLDPKVIVAQAALETGWGKSIIKHSDGRSSHNLFNIKADKSWQEDKVNINTLEYRNGIARTERANFRGYQSFEDSFSDYVQFLQTNPRYQTAMQKTDNPQVFVKELQRAGYATDPNYAKKVWRIFNSDTLANAMTKLDLK